MLTPKDFVSIIRLTPLISIDLIIRNQEDRVLVGLRTNEPAKGIYFVPGGVIRKGESLEQAFSRILAGETGLDEKISSARFLGAYEHFYESNRFNEPGYGTHYVVLGYELKLDHKPQIKTDDQHSAVRWMTDAEILSASDVHENTKAYVRS